MAISASTLTSCEDQPDKFELTGGVPTVNYIRMPYLSQADSLLDKASLSSVICLVGNNLTSIKELYFNDQKAQLNTSYITDHTMIVQIPAAIPADVTDKIYMVTRDGEKVDYDFKVVVPAPNPTSMSCEYAKPGSEVSPRVLYLSYFLRVVTQKELSRLRLSTASLRLHSIISILVACSSTLIPLGMV